MVTAGDNLKTSPSPLSSALTADGNADVAETEVHVHVAHAPVPSYGPVVVSNLTLLFNPIADTKEIAYDSSKGLPGNNEQDSFAPENAASCTAGSNSSSCVGRDTNVTTRSSEDPTFRNGGRANGPLFFLTLRAFGSCLLRPLGNCNGPAKQAAPRKRLRLLPKRRGIRSRLHLFKSRSSSSDGSDPTITTTLMNGEQNHPRSGGSGDFPGKIRTVPALHTNELFEGSVSEVCDVSFYHNEDDDTLDDASYAFSQAAGISEEEPKGYDDIGIGSIWNVRGYGSEGLLAATQVDKACTDVDTSTGGADGEDATALLFNDDDETGGDLFALADTNEDDKKESNGENDEEKDKLGSSEVSTMFRSNSVPDELEYIQPMFRHKSLRQASEKQTSYDFIINVDEEDDNLCAAEGK